MIRALLRAAARLLVAVQPPDVRDRFGADLGADWERVLERDLRTAGGARKVARRLARDALALPPAWFRWARSEREKSALGDAARSLARNRRFTGTVVGILSVGMALTAAVSSVLDAYLLRGLPFPESDRLVGVETVVPELSWADPGLDEVFEVPISWDLDAFTLVDGDRPRQVRGQWVAPGFLDAFGLQPALGRGFLPEEGDAGATSVAVIGHGLWMERYGGDPDILGRTIPAFTSDRPEDAESFTVVGVLPPDVWFFNRYTEFLAPLRADNPVYMGRLAAGMTVDEASRRLDRLARARGWVPRGGSGAFEVRRYHDRYLDGVRTTLLLLATAVALVLLITCGNVAMLVLVRTDGRAQELGIRRALGASRGRLARQLLAEGLLLGTVSAALGVVLAGALVEFAGTGVEAGLGVAVPGGVDALRVRGVVLAGTAALAVLVGVLFGLLPLLARPGGEGTTAGIAGGSRGATSDRNRRLLQDVVVAGELALSLALLIGAGLTVRSAVHLSTAELGFEPEALTTAQVTIRSGSYPEPEDRRAFHDRLVEGARALPGVESAALALRVPFAWGFQARPVESEEAAGADEEALPDAVVQLVGPDFFRTMGIPLRAGRALTQGDGEGSERVAVVSASLAAALWPDRDPLGRLVRPVPGPGAEEGPETPWYRVVGVVGDVWNSVETGQAADLYLPVAEFAPASVTVLLRRGPGAPSPIPALDEVVRALDPSVPLADVTEIGPAVDDARAPSRALAAVLSGFGLFAVLLAVVGLYGVVAYTTGRRAREVAVRMALGADAGRVVRRFLLRGAAVVVPGLVAGLLGGRLLGRLMAGQLRGVSPGDPLVFGTLGTLLAVATLVATWIPARRAAKTDPMQVLGAE